NFWASWCVPCRRENGALDAFYERWRDRGVEVVGILYADDTGSARAFRDELGGSWPLVNDPDGRVALDFGVAGVPETFVIDARGVVMAKLIGAVGPTTLDDVLAQITAGGPPVTAENDDYRQGPGR
ncbi:MAG: TlpA family protein disulfide reductase, partial [Acidimicrobiia bacterium]